MEFSEKIQELRNKNKLTQEQFAEKLYVSRTAVSKWESGKGYPSIDSLKYISKTFNISIDELLSIEEIIDIAKKENTYNLERTNKLARWT
jgi:transcriptional regulator with XRE-family HTH domain